MRDYLQRQSWPANIPKVVRQTQALALEESLIGQLSPLYNKDLHPFQKEFGTQMAVGPNLPKSQISLRFFIEWGH